MSHQKTIGPVWVVLPTYNEAENLPRVLAAVLGVLGEHAPPGSGVLVVDDNSPDGTGEVADRLARTDRRIRVLHRPFKEGLGRAYVDGFRTVLALGAELIVQMDADLSHEPGRLAGLLEAARTTDVVIGSRYVPGGKTQWSAARRALSRFGSAYARTMLGLWVRDLTGGFKCFRREVLEAIDVATVDAQGYVFQIETTYRAVRLGFTVREIPITFRDRVAGESKMRPRIALEAFWRVPMLRLRTVGMQPAPIAVAVAAPAPEPIAAPVAVEVAA